MERSNVFEVPETTIKIVSELLEEAIDLIEEKHAYFKTEKDSLCTENLENGIDKKTWRRYNCDNKTCQFKMEVLIWNEMRF